MPDTVITIGGDNRDLLAKLSASATAVTNFGSQVQGIGSALAGIAAPIASVVGLSALKDIFNEFDQVGDLAARFDTTATSIQRLGFISGQSGTDLETVVPALQKLNINLSKADTDPALAKAFKTLNVDVNAFKSLDPEQQIVQLAAGFQAAKNPTEAYAAAFAVLGRSAGAMLPILRTSREELDAMSKVQVISDAQIATIQKAGDKLDELWMRGKVGIADFSLKAVDSLGAMAKAYQAASQQSSLLGKYNAFIGTYQDTSAQQRGDAANGEAEAKAKLEQKKLDQAAADKFEATEANIAKAGTVALDNDKKAAALAWEKLSAEQQLAVVKAQLAANAKSSQATTDPLQGAQLESQRLDLTKEQAKLEKQLATDRQQQQGKQQKQVDAQRDLGAELALLTAKANGQKDLVKQLEREKALKEEIAKITAAGIDPKQARQIAEFKQQQQDKIAAQAQKADKPETKGKIHGYSQAQRDPSYDDPFRGLNKHARDNAIPLKDTFKFPVLDARKAAQEAAKGAGDKAADAAKMGDPNALLQQLVTLFASVDGKLTIAN